MPRFFCDEKHELIIIVKSHAYEHPNPNKRLQDPDGLSAVGGDPFFRTRLIHLCQ